MKNELKGVKYATEIEEEASLDVRYLEGDLVDRLKLCKCSVCGASLTTNVGIEDIYYVITNSQRVPWWHRHQSKVIGA